MVSIIIPVYNGEKFLEECLRSVVNQSYKDIEIICVDDGSTDSSLDILNRYAAKDERVRVLHQKNKGAAMARNNALPIAKGDYVVFWDCDDVFDIHFIEKMLNKAISLDLDVVICDGLMFNPDNRKSSLGLDLGKYAKRTSAICNDEISDRVFNDFLIAPWNKIYKKSFLFNYNIKFQDIPRSNDLFFMCQVMSRAKRIAVINEKLVFYRVGNGNSLQADNIKSPLAFIDALIKTRGYLQENALVHIFEKSFLVLAMNVILYNLSTLKNPKVFNEVVYRLKYNGFEEMGIHKESLLRVDSLFYYYYIVISTFSSRLIINRLIKLGNSLSKRLRRN